MKPFELSKVIINEEGKESEAANFIIFESHNLVNIFDCIKQEIDKIDKCIDEIFQEYEKDRLINRRNEILKNLENQISREESADLERELNEIIIKLARIK